MEEPNTTDLSLNNSTAQYTDSQAVFTPVCTPDSRVLATAGVFTGISLCGLVGNMVVVWFLGFHMKKSPFTVYVLNLAIADFSLLLFLLVIIVAGIISEVYCFFSFPLLLAHIVLREVFHFFYFASMNLLTAMSMERCLSVLFPIWYRCHRPKHLSGIMCGLLWTLAGLCGSSFFTCTSLSRTTTCNEIAKGVSTVNFLAFSIFPFLSNLSLFIKLRCGSERRSPGRLYVAVLISVIFLFIFGFPLTVSFFLLSYNGTFSLLHAMFCLLASLNSCTNPFIYFLVGSCRQRRLQGSARAALRQVFEEKGMKEEGRDVPGEPGVETSL
ncbi:mas-related G-protein coupled receptor member A6-like [Apus apus]|uniref:mas-related G-protein coupled receptor member A6-like n=1 Tax=Apus apus TaxID=8895 RepID=UPI0021F81B01|nr:mas-related G-protein coupled receptor member A6-like [Apus apus]